MNKYLNYTNKHNNQFGFTAKSSTLHPLFIVNEAMSTAITTKSKFLALSLDAEKAFDRV